MHDYTELYRSAFRKAMMDFLDALEDVSTIPGCVEWSHAHAQAAVAAELPRGTVIYFDHEEMTALASEE